MFMSIKRKLCFTKERKRNFINTMEMRTKSLVTLYNTFHWCELNENVIVCCVSGKILSHFYVRTYVSMQVGSMEACMHAGRQASMRRYLNLVRGNLGQLIKTSSIKQNIY